MMHAIIDFRPVFKEWAVSPGLFPIYRNYPLRDIVTSVLYMKAYNDHNELFWLELEKRYPPEEQFDYDNLEFALSLLVRDIDDTMRMAMSNSEEYVEYTILKWVNETAALMIREEHVGLYHTQQSAYSPFAEDKLLFDPTRSWLG